MSTSESWLKGLHTSDDTLPATEADIVCAARMIVDAARERGILLATAESCTGGLVSSALTAIPGSSDVVLGGIVSYSNSVKHKVLGVSKETLAQAGAVSEDCVLQMAAGACRLTGANLAVAVSGIAGPGGGTEQKPVGTVWFGRAFAEDLSFEVRCTAELHHFSGERDEVRAKSVLCSLSLIYEQIVES